MGVSPTKPFATLGIISGMSYITHLLAHIAMCKLNDMPSPFFSDDGKKLIHKVDIKLNRCSVCHDIGITQR